MPGPRRHRNGAVARQPRSAVRSGRDRSSACSRRCRRAARSSAASTRCMLAARPMPDSSMPPCHTGMPCDAHRSCSRIDSREPADPARLDVDDAARAGGDRVARDAARLDRLVEADRRLQPPLQHRVIGDVVVIERLLDHHQVERDRARPDDRRRPACRPRWHRPSAGCRRTARAPPRPRSRSHPGLILILMRR